MADELSEVEQAKIWMVGMFKADAQLTPILATRVYADQAYRELGFPYLLVTYMSGSDKNALGTTREQTIANFQVRIVVEKVIDVTARNAEKRMDYLLQHSVKVLSGAYYFTARRMQPINRPEYDMVKTLRYHNIGGIYRLWIYSAS